MTVINGFPKPNTIMTYNILIISFLVPEQCVKKVIQTPVHIFFFVFYVVVFLDSSFTLELGEAQEEGSGCQKSLQCILEA